jgi:Ca-activated chloride channel homolog
LFDLELTWDRSAHTGQYAGEHVLRIRVRPRPGAAGSKTLPVRMAIAVDTSGSMEGGKLKSAMQACASVVGQLRPEDNVWIASFSTKLVPLLDGVAGNSTVNSLAQAELAKLRAEGVTRTDYALDWMARALQQEAGTVRVGVLITDGHPTDPKGNALPDVKALLQRAGELGGNGIRLLAIGLGSADDFNAPFLDDVSKSGKGAYLYADEPSSLDRQLAGQFHACQTMAIEDAILSIRPLIDDVRFTGFCRIRPDFVPMDLAGSLKVGSLRADVPTDFLLSVTIPPRWRMEQPLGPLTVLEVSLGAKDTATAKQEAAIEYTPSFSRAQQRDTSVDHDRLNWEINIHADALSRTDDPAPTVLLLASLGAAAQKAGQDDLAQQAFRQIDELKKSGNMSAHKRSIMLTSARGIGAGS